MKLATAADVAFVVRRHDGPVVAAFWGADAGAEALLWVEKGYQVDQVDRATLEA